MARENAAQAQKPAGEVIPVVNNTESLTQIQLPGVPGKGGDIRHGPLIKLVPGLNFIDSDLWMTAKKNSSVMILLEEKILNSRAPEQNPERVGYPKLVDGPPLPRDRPLEAMPEKDAVEMVKEVCDLAILKQLERHEARSNVMSAIRRAREAIEKPQLRPRKN